MSKNSLSTLSLLCFWPKSANISGASGYLTGHADIEGTPGHIGNGTNSSAENGDNGSAAGASQMDMYMNEMMQMMGMMGMGQSLNPAAVCEEEV